jgi:GNAT superfamily N-acetyltransferase
MERLRTGAVIQIRPISPSDTPSERAFLARLPPEYVSYRFLGLIKNCSDDVAHELTHIDPSCEVALVAITKVAEGEAQIGVAQYRVRGDGHCCDCAVTVDPEWQHCGVGRLLMLRLIEVAHARGIRRMYAVDPVRCAGAHRLAECLGFHCRPDPEDPVVTTFELTLH